MYIQTKFTEKADLYACLKVTGGIFLLLACVGGALYASGFMQGTNAIPYTITAGGTLAFFAGNTLIKYVKYTRVKKRKREFLIVNLIIVSQYANGINHINNCIHKDPSLLDAIALEYLKPTILSYTEIQMLTLIPSLYQRSKELQGLSASRYSRLVQIPKVFADPNSSFEPEISAEEI